VVVGIAVDLFELGSDEPGDDMTTKAGNRTTMSA